MTIKDLLVQGNALLKGHVDAPFLDARLLLEHILGISHTRLLLRVGNSVDQESVKRFHRALNRRLNGECTAYIIGYKEFWGLPFIITPDVLVPRPDTETLVETALNFIKQGWMESVLELCTGSGAVAVSLKREVPYLSVTAGDVSRKALAVARENAQHLQADVTFVYSDLFEHIEGRFDLIVANPPYIPTCVIETLAREVQNEPRLALDGGEDGLVLIRRIIASVIEHLYPRGVLLIEAAPEQMIAIREMMSRYRNIQTFCDLAGRERVIAGTGSDLGLALSILNSP
ncbi:MAG: peptide chain release factor N(5)-glutamine methyltransferase [Treponema sp.]|jgi:release factor glutamine methyltransferase|nr:peptide chain release factor N(5)-glutamine methyltransferase [Treponema sp.]